MEMIKDALKPESLEMMRDIFAAEDEPVNRKERRKIEALRRNIDRDAELEDIAAYERKKALAK